MRQIYSNLTGTNNNIKKISFYSASQGYIASSDNGGCWVGFTTDSGRTITKRFITQSNVNYNGYSVNLPFILEGVKAFSQDTIIAYGGFNLTPAILYSTNGGLTYLLVFHSQFGPTQIGWVYDMSFPQNNNIGFAVDGYRILKTTNKGQSWVTSLSDGNGPFGALDAIDNNNVFAFSDYLSGTGDKLFKTSNAGTSWQQVTIPLSGLRSVDFLTPLKGWANVFYNSDSAILFYTSNGGSSWAKKNDGVATPVGFMKMRFSNDSTGYAIGGLYETYKTTDTGKIWEPLLRDNNFSYLGFGHEDIQVLNQDQLWSGGGREFLEISTNGGGTPLPKAFFKIDTTGMTPSGIINLRNFSKTNYTHKWYRNNVLISTSYHASYTRDISSFHDSIKLVVNNGVRSDSLTLHQYFISPVGVSSFFPTTAATGTVVSINGNNFTGATSVSFGGVAAASFTVSSSSNIQATVGPGASGEVRVTTPLGSGALGGFIYLPPPTITSFTPTIVGTGYTVIISGAGFTGAFIVKFGASLASSFTIINATTISAVVGVGSSGAVSVQTPQGTASLGGLTYISPPTITSVTPNTTGPGTTVSITGTNFTGATSVNFGAVPASSFVVNSSTNISAVVPVGAGNGIVVTIPVGGSSNAFSFFYTTLPIIHTLSPSNGPVGSTVNINGANFSINPLSNIVYFGPVRANVISATANTLTVVVPVGASSERVTVVTNYLLTTSPTAFQVTFPGDQVFTSSSFAGRVDFPSGNYTRDVAAGDFDGDGKPDMVTVNTFSSSISIFRNTSTVNTLSFAAKIDSTTGLKYKPVNVLAKDIDCDGKLDIAILCQDTTATLQAFGRAIIYRNTSTPGIISFAARVEIAAGLGPIDFVIADLDNDSKPDVSILNAGDETFTYFRNTSNGSAISFYPGFTIDTRNGNTFGFPRCMIAGDFDGNGKIDILIGKQGSGEITVLQNGSTLPVYNGFIKYFLGGFSPFSFAAPGDFDGDGKEDFISNWFVSRNLTQPPPALISFNAAIFNDINGRWCVAGGLNGDTKPDFVRTNFTNSTVSVVRNTGTSGVITLVTDATFATGQTPGEVKTADMDLDHRPDILVANTGSNNVSILKSQVQFNGAVIFSFTPTSGITGTTVTITGTGFTGATAVSFGGVAASSFTVVNATTITAVVASGASGVVTVVTPVGTASLAGFTYGTAPAILSFVPTIGATGTTITITGSNFTGTTAVSFGGVAATSFIVVNPTTITAVVSSGASGNVAVTSPGGTASAAGFTYVVPTTIISFNPVAAGSGTTVTITGTNLTGVTAVSFGGQAAASFTIINSTTITAVVGQGSSGDVSVITSAGTVTRAGFTFIFAPTISSFTPISASTGTTVTITGTFFTGATAVRFGGIAASSFTVVSATTITAVVGNGASGSVSVTTAGGTGTTTGFTYTIVTAVGDPNSNNSKELLISPNPASDIILVKHPASIKNSYLKLIDINGRTVKLVTVGRNLNQTSLSVKGVAVGIYKLIWTDEKRTYRRTLMITQE